MDAKQAYDFWASLYDTNKNNTRDLEATAIREMLLPVQFKKCLEIGCGTGKNTGWLSEKPARVTAVDISGEMLEKARQKVTSPDVIFVHADITGHWDFAGETYDLVSFSLVLEHIQFLETIFLKAVSVLEPGGYLYLGELHPFKQYTGTKARFDTESGRQVVDCYNHHVSDFTNAGRNAGLTIVRINEYFDSADRNEIPRILAILFQKPEISAGL